MPNPTAQPFGKRDKTLLTQLVAVLSTLPDVKARSTRMLGGPRQYDAEIDLVVSGKSVKLLVEAMKAVFPRDVRQLLWQIKRESGTPKSLRESQIRVPLVAAESISNGARDVLREEGVGYFDTGGSLYIPAPGAYVFVDKPAPPALARSVRTLFAGRRSQVLHAMLHAPGEWLGVNQLSERASVSPSTASETLAALERFDWVDSRGQGPAKERSLREPGALLDAWAKEVATLRSPPMRRYFVPNADTDGIVERLHDACERNKLQYALTYESAAQRYSSFITHISQVRCLLPGTSHADSVMSVLGARAVNEGANLVIVEAKLPADFLFREQVRDVWLASPILVYLDLLRGEGRSKELAEHLRRDRIGF
jgi:hypothetical protein